MNTAIEAVKDEVAKKQEYLDFITALACAINKQGAYLGLKELDNLINEVVELYHARKCSEAGRELPDVETSILIWENLASSSLQEELKSKRQGAQWMKEKASTLLASLQSQLETKEQELRESVDCTEHMKEVCDNYQKELEAKDKEVDRQQLATKRIHSTSLKILEVKDKEIEELKYKNELLEHELKYYDKEPEEDDFERYPLPICFEPREELKELNLRKDRIDENWEKWNERMVKIKSQLSTKDNTEGKMP